MLPFAKLLEPATCSTTTSHLKLAMHQLSSNFMVTIDDQVSSSAPCSSPSARPRIEIPFTWRMGDVARGLAILLTSY